MIAFLPFCITLTQSTNVDGVSWICYIEYCISYLYNIRCNMFGMRCGYSCFVFQKLSPVVCIHKISSVCTIAFSFLFHPFDLFYLFIIIIYFLIHFAERVLVDLEEYCLNELKSVKKMFASSY